MSFAAPKSLFYSDYTIPLLELKGNYEMWVLDVENYFSVSRLLEHFASIRDNTEPDIRHDLIEEVKKKKTTRATRSREATTTTTTTTTTTSSLAELVEEEDKEELLQISLKVRHDLIMTQSRFVLWKGIGESIKREITREQLVTATSMDLWVAIRSCFYLHDESTTQQIKGDIWALDMGSAGSWTLFAEQIQRLYSRLETIAPDRCYNASDKLHKLTNVLKKLEGEAEKSLFVQVELMIDGTDKEARELYDQIYRFTDKRMRTMEKEASTVVKHAAFQAVAKQPFCTYCKKSGHIIKDCTKTKTRKAVDIVCGKWNKITKLCDYESKTGFKCKFKHSDEAAHLVIDEQPCDGIAWMVGAVGEWVIENMTGSAKENYWVLDGGATINLSNGHGFIPGTRKSKKTIIEVVGGAKITSIASADYKIDCFVPGKKTSSSVTLYGVPIVPTLKYNLVAERTLLDAGWKVHKAGTNCWITEQGSLKAVCHTAKSPALSFLATTSTIAEMVEECPVGYLFSEVEKRSVQMVEVHSSKAKPMAEPIGVNLLCANFADSKNKPVFYPLAHSERQNAISLEPFPQKDVQAKENVVFHTHQFGNSDTLTLWHERLGHLNFASVARMLNIKPPVKAVFCQSCCQGKSTLTPAPHDKATRATRTGELLHSDMAGPMEVNTPSGKRYILVFIDDFSRRIFIRLLHNKNEFLKEFVALDKLIEVETTHRVAFLRSDSDGVYVSGELNEYCRRRSIQRQYSTAYNQFQNGVAERAIRTLVEMMRTLIIHAGAPKFLWGEAACYSAQIMNRKPTTALTDFPNPMSAWRGVSLINAHLSLRTWGCKVLFIDHRPKVKKLDSKTLDGVMVGLDTESKSWRVMYGGQVVCRRDVTFIEDIFPYKNKSTAREKNVLKVGDEYKHVNLQENIHEGDIFQEDPLSDNTRSEIDTKNDDEESVVLPRMSRRTWKPTPAILDSFALNAVSREKFTPKTYKQAINSEDRELWQESVDKEILSHLKNNTLLSCSLPEGRKAVPLGWVFKVKDNPDGTVRYKSRIIMKGYLQREGIDFTNTYAPVAKWTSIRIFLALSNMFDYDLAHLDFETAFMVPTMDADVYVSFTDGMNNLSPSSPYAKLLKGVNGCKQGSHLFYEEVKGSLLLFGFSLSLFDSCVFIMFKDGEICIVIVWVDDLLIGTKGKLILQQLLEHLKKKYKFNIIYEPTLFLGVNITRNRKERKMIINQETFCCDVLRKFKFDKMNSIGTPMEHGKQYVKTISVTEEEKKYLCDKPYRSLACSLMYPSNITRPDLSYACNIASRHLQNPSKEHWKLLKRTSRYLKSTTSIGLTYSAEHKEITGWPDASWGDNKDDRKSTGAYLFFIGRCLVSWRTKKQSFIAHSTNNAELGALFDASREAFYIRCIVNEMVPNFINASTPIKIFEDNEGTISQANNNIMNDATRTIALKFHYVREEIKCKRISLVSVSSANQMGDFLTKALHQPRFIHLRDQICGIKAWDIDPSL